MRPSKKKNGVNALAQLRFDSKLLMNDRLHLAMTSAHNASVMTNNSAMTSASLYPASNHRLLHLKSVGIGWACGRKYGRN